MKFSFQRPEPVSKIYIMKEKIIQTYDKGEALVIDYFVDGHAYNAVFYQNEEKEYNRFKEYLHALGTIIDD